MTAVGEGYDGVEEVGKRVGEHTQVASAGTVTGIRDWKGRDSKSSLTTLRVEIRFYLGKKKKRDGRCQCRRSPGGTGDHDRGTGEEGESGSWTCQVTQDKFRSDRG